MRKLIAASIILLAVAAVAEAAPIRRRVLALHKGSEGDSVHRNMTLALLEQPLESLGLVVDHHDVEKGLLSDREMEPYRGVVSFFRGPDMKNALGYVRWMSRQLDRGRKVVIVGDVGALRDSKTGANLSHAQINELFRRLGLRYDGFGTSDPALVDIAGESSDMSFEEPFTDTSAEGFVLIRCLSSNVTSYLTLVRLDLKEGLSHPVVATPTGGFAHGPLLLHEYRQDGIEKQRWHLNPYRFLSDAFALASEPRLQTSSLNGQRLWMAHIDGDGFLSAAGPGRLCGQAVLEDVLERFPFPVSVSMISDDLSRDTRALPLARRLFALPHVEAASHSASHPMDWTARGVDTAREVTASARVLQSVLPPDKKLSLITWSGLCNPPAAALRAAKTLGLANINGPNTDGGFVNRFDEMFPSRTHLSPLTRTVDGLIQVSHLAANDYELADRWSEKQRGRYRDIIDTLERTAADPQRPAHVYFHFYSAHTAESLEALLQVFEWSGRKSFSRVFVSDHARLVDDFRNATMERVATDRYRVANAGHCRTLVVPGAQHVDMTRSVGVIGYSKQGPNLQVFLSDEPEHEIALADRPSPTMHLVSAGGWVDRWSVAGSTAAFELRAFGPTDVTLAVPDEGHYRLTARPGDTRQGRRDFIQVAAAQDGIVRFQLAATGRDVILVEPYAGHFAAARTVGVPAVALSLAAFPLWFYVRARRRLGT